MTDYRWETVVERNPRYGTVTKQVRKPLDKCPHCGEYKLRRYRKEGRREVPGKEKILFWEISWSNAEYFEWGDIYEKCANCSYRKQIQNEEEQKQE